MTDGQKLKTTLGLEKYKNVYITRMILPHSQRICMVFYDSRRPNTLASIRGKISPYVGMVYSGIDLKKDEFNKPVMTPLLNIEEWNGNLNRYVIVPINLAFALQLKSVDFARMPESIYQIKQFKKQDSIYIGKEALAELTLYDLKDKGTISDFTQKWVKDRNRTTGAGNISIKLVDMFLDEAGKSVTFQFLSEATELNGKEPDEDLGKYGSYKGGKGEVNPKNFKIGKNPSKVYELQIKILKFWEWLDVFEGEEITSKELKEILKVSDVQVFSTSPSFHWQSQNFFLSQLDGSIYPTDIAPKVWNKLHGESFLDKHLFSLLRQIDFFIPQLAQKLNSTLKSRNLI